MLRPKDQKINVAAGDYQLSREENERELQTRRDFLYEHI